MSESIELATAVDESGRYRKERFTDRERFFLGVAVFTSFAVILLSLLRITTSSLILHGGTGKSNSARLIAGQPRVIRADEWNRSTPTLLGRLSDNWSPDFKSIFEARVSHAGILETLASFAQTPEEKIARAILSVHAFFPLWWLPVALAFVSLVGLYLLWGFGKSASVVAALVVVAIPTTSWWSYHPLEILWPLATGFLLVEIARRISASDRGLHSAEIRIGSLHLQWARVRQATSISISIVAGVLVSRIPFGYLPWALPAAVIYFCLVLDWMSWKGIYRSGYRSYLIGFVALVMSVGFKGAVYLNLYQTLRSTVYPGGRRSGGGDIRQPLFTGAQAVFLQFRPGEDLVGTNQSEAALGPLILVVVVLLLTVYAMSRFGARALIQRGVPVLSVGAIAVFVVWTLVPWPSFLLEYNPLSVLPAYRVGQILGVIAIVPSTLALVKIVGMVSPSSRTGIAITSACFTLIVSVIGGISFSEYMPKLSINQVWLTSAIFALCIGAAIAFSKKSMFLLPLLCFLVLSSFRINPVVQGLGDLRDSDVASDIRDAALPTDSLHRVATDDFQLDALAAANGLAMASGQVLWGPNEEVWHLLDPGEKYRDSWNRGAASLRFDWQDDAQAPVIWSPVDDMIIITIDPCSPILDRLRVEWIISSRPIQRDCVTERSKFLWMGGDRWMYQVT